MVQKTEYYMSSSNGTDKLHLVEWQPEGEVQGILQISHGMIEYIDRYDRFARFMAERGFVVIGNDHLDTVRQRQKRIMVTLPRKMGAAM